MGAAGRPVEEKVPEIADKVEGEGEGDQSRKIAGEQGRAKGLRSRSSARPPEPVNDEPCQQGDRDRLQKVSRVCSEEKVLKSHILRKIHGIVLLFLMNEF